jgi:hypothetical protein
LQSPGGNKTSDDGLASQVHSTRIFTPPSSTCNAANVFNDIISEIDDGTVGYGRRAEHMAKKVKEHIDSGGDAPVLPRQRHFKMV